MARTDGHKSDTWTFLSNHTHVLICLSRDPCLRLREVAQQVGLTERGVQKIVRELASAGLITRFRQGRRNRYRIHPDHMLRHPVEAQCSVADLLRMAGAFPPRQAPLPAGQP